MSGGVWVVYCTECGARNPDDAKFCVKCGAALYPERSPGRVSHGRAREMCFGVPVSGRIWGVVFGLVIVLWGLSDLMGRRLNFFAILAIVFGFAILSGALKGSSRR